MSNLARQLIYFGRQFELDEIVAGIDAVTAEGVQALAHEVLDGRRATAALLGRLDGVRIDPGEIAF
jgi:predicted Zn-dependent peptidase